MKDVFTDVITGTEYDALSDEDKGYVSYIQACWPGSEVPGRPGPGVDKAAFARGETRAVADVTDVEE